MSKRKIPKKKYAETTKTRLLQDDDLKESYASEAKYKSLGQKSTLLHMSLKSKNEIRQSQCDNEIEKIKLTSTKFNNRNQKQNKSCMKAGKKQIQTSEKEEKKENAKSAHFILDANNVHTYDRQSFESSNKQSKKNGKHKDSKMKRGQKNIFDRQSKGKKSSFSKNKRNDLCEKDQQCQLI